MSSAIDVRSVWLQRKPEIACVIAAVIIAHAYFIAWLEVPILHDAAGYLRLARQIATEGLFTKYEMSELRTYLYPWCLGWLVRLSESTGISVRLLAFECQLMLYILASLSLRLSLLRTGLPASFARLTFGVVVLNPLVLIYSGYLLTESFSMSLEVVLLACAVAVIAASSLRATIAAAAALTFVNGMMIMTRPANVYFLPTVAVALGLAIWNRRLRPRATLLVLAAAFISLSLPFLPQLSNNIRYYGKATPLIVSSLGSIQQQLGVRYIKFATTHIPNQFPQVRYDNPFYHQEPLDQPLLWYLQHPGQGIATVALHVFDLLDQDLPFPYSTTLLPWYYPLASMLNLLIVATGLTGVLLAPFYLGPYGFTAASVYVIAVTTLACHFGLHSMTRIEARFGVPALLILYVFAAWAVAFILPRLPSRVRVAILSGLGITVLAGSHLSAWVRNQAPSIRIAVEAQDPQLREAARKVTDGVIKGKAFLSPDLPDWTLVDAGVAAEGQAVLVSKGSGQVSLIQHAVTLGKSKNYVVTFDARALIPPDAPLSVDLYAPGYDNPEQNSIFTPYGSNFTSFTARWNSGPAAPVRAWLRFATLSTTPIEIRQVTFYAAK